MENTQENSSYSLGSNRSVVQQSRACFQRLLRKIQQTNWKINLSQSVKKYCLESYKLAQLTPKTVEKLYQKISLKYRIDQTPRMKWHQNELRLYIWFLATSSGVFGLSPSSYSSDQLKELSQPFFGIHQDLCQYQYRAAVCPQLFRAWESEENALLSQIFKKHGIEGSWSAIAKQLFLQSNKKYFRTPQTCRERWQNHLDDRKVRGQWTLQQDYLLIKHIVSEGKRWSVIAKKIGDTRTEHMIKNRFQTIMRREFKQKKKPTRFSEEFQFCKQLMKKLSQKLSQGCVPKLEENRGSQRHHSYSGSQQETQNLGSAYLELQHSQNPVDKYVKSGATYKASKSLKAPQIEDAGNIKEEYQQSFVAEAGIPLGSSELGYGMSCEWTQKYYSGEKFGPQLELEIPLFIEEALFLHQDPYDLLSDFMQQTM